MLTNLPGSLDAVVPQPSPDDLAACRALLCDGSRSFFAAALLLPRRVHRPATALYAFCRVADDLIDGSGPCAGAALAQLRLRLDAVYAGDPQPHAPDRALAAVAARHGIPRALLDALLDGFAWDAAGRQYETLAELEAYAARAAGAVGAMMALLMGARSEQAAARACDLGMAMQLSNIARDVGEDARAGRLYLPRAWLREAGIDPDAWLARPAFSPALAGVVRRLLLAADVLYARADSGIAALPLACRPGIGAARRLYAGIGREVARNGYDSLSRRAAVPPARKLGLVLRSTARALRPRAAPPSPASHPAQFLVDAVMLAGPAGHGLGARPSFWQSFDDRVAWLCALYERIDSHQAQRSLG